MVYYFQKPASSPAAQQVHATTENDTLAFDSSTGLHEEQKKRRAKGGLRLASQAYSQLQRTAVGEGFSTLTLRLLILQADSAAILVRESGAGVRAAYIEE